MSGLSKASTNSPTRPCTKSGRKMKHDLQELSTTTSLLPYHTDWSAPVQWPDTISAGISTTGGMLIFYGDRSGWVFEAAKKLEALGRLQPGWDSYGGLPLLPEAKRLTHQVL